MLNWLYEIVARVILFWHGVWANVFSETSDVAWVLSIVFLTITVRVLIFPLFMKQIKSQRAMQLLAPKIKELQAKHKGDRETMNRELMKLYKDNKANPLAGCLPLLLQMPIFFALFNVLRKIDPERVTPLYGIPPDLVHAAANATFFGAPIAASFTDSADSLSALGGASTTTVRVVTLIMILAMGITTFITQKQMMARQAATADSQQAQIQKILLYVMPISFAVFGVNFPLGVLLYWLTTNLWAMGQQQYVIRRMPPPGQEPATKGAKPTVTTAPSSNGSSPDGEAAGGGAATAVADRPAQPVHVPNRQGRKSGSRAQRKRKGR